MAQAAANGSPRGLVYRRSTGELTLDGRSLATGYSGSGAAKNNPEMQSSQGQGLIPQGTNTMDPQFYSPATGPGAIRLTPNRETEKFGRKDFEMNGDSIRHPGTASEGCIIMPPEVRKQVAALLNRALTVMR